MHLSGEGEGGLSRGDGKPILVAGAGICGLATALSLGRMGFAVKLLEGREAFYETGAGLQLGPHAVKVLDRLGLSPALNDAAVTPEAIVVRSAASAKPLVRIPLGTFARERYGAPYWCLHRQDLHRALQMAVEAESGITVDFGFRVTGVTEDAGSVSVTGSTGETVEGRGLIGADGLWSQVRRAVDPEGYGPQRTLHSGWTAWRAMVPIGQCPADIERDCAGLWLGADAHVVHYPVRSGSLLNIVVVLREDFEGEGFDQAGDPAVLEAAIRHWPEAVRRLAGQARQDWQRWSLYERAPNAPWSRGRMLLAGDAAHPVLPFLAQGAALALEDAWSIAAQAARMDDLPTAWQAVEAGRRARAEAVAKASRRNAWAFHLGGAAGQVRNLALSCMGGRRLLSAYDWLYAHDETATRPLG